MIGLHTRVSEDLHHSAKVAAAQHRTTLQAMVERGLVLCIKELKAKPSAKSPDSDKLTATKQLTQEMV